MMNSNIDIVLRYFSAIDNRDSSVLPDIFAETATQEFLGLPTISGISDIVEKFNLQVSQLDSMTSEILDVVSGENTVVIQVRHTAVIKSGGVFLTRSGIQPSNIVGPFSTPTTIEWRALALFKLENGKVISEVIIRDDLGVLMQTRTVTFSVLP